MKNLVAIAFFIISTLNISAQDYSKLKEIKLSDSLSCLLAHAKVLECCNYLFKTPCKENINSANATQFIINWMDATPTYTFGLDNSFFQAIKYDMNLVGRYYAALAKTALENNITENNFELQFNSIIKVLDYAEKKRNKINVSEKLQKYIDAKTDTTLNLLLPR